MAIPKMGRSGAYPYVFSKSGEVVCLLRDGEGAKFESVQAAENAGVADLRGKQAIRMGWTDTESMSDM